MRDLVPLRRSTFELGLPRSQLSPLRRRMSVEGQRECTTPHTTARGPPLARGCIYRACLTRVYPRAKAQSRDNAARVRATSAEVLSNVYDPPT